MANRRTLLAMLCLVFLASYAHAAKQEELLIVRLQAGISPAEAKRILNSQNLEVKELLVADLNLYSVRVKPSKRGMQKLLAEADGHDQVVYAQADHKVTLRYLPSDDQFEKQWSLHNTKGAAEVHATEAWDVFHGGGKDRNGNDVVIAVIDDGFDIKHSDLAPNIWVNPGEIPANAIDDEGNGYIDDVHGWNAYDDNGTIPVAAHGTHVAGIAGARGDNGKFIAGISWNAKLMPIAGSSGQTSMIVKSYGYIIAQKKLWLASKGKKGANIVVTNSSFGVDYGDCTNGSFPVWNDLYDQMGKLGILSTVATINDSVDVDKQGDVPSGCGSKYLITVTNSDKNDKKDRFAGYGSNHIMLAAPGEDILSTMPKESVGELSGTSMAAPHVSGTIALMHSAASEVLNRRYADDPAGAALLFKRLLLENVDVIPTLAKLVSTGGRLNIAHAVSAASKY